MGPGLSINMSGGNPIQTGGRGYNDKVWTTKLIGRTKCSKPKRGPLGENECFVQKCSRNWIELFC